MLTNESFRFPHYLVSLTLFKPNGSKNTSNIWAANLSEMTLCTLMEDASILTLLSWKIPFKTVLSLKTSCPSDGSHLNRRSLQWEQEKHFNAVEKNLNVHPLCIAACPVIYFLSQWEWSPEQDVRESLPNRDANPNQANILTFARSIQN